MRALFVQHDHVSPVGPVGERFSERGYTIDELVVVPADRFHAPAVVADFPDPTSYDVIVPMGAPWSVYDLATIGPWIEPELEFLRRALGAGREGHPADVDLIRIPIEPRSFGVQSERSEWEKVRIPGDGRTGGGVPTVR